MPTDRAVTARQILQLLMSSVVVYSQSFRKYNHMYAQQLPANLSLYEARTEGECPMICGSSAQDGCYGFRFTKNGKGNGECQIFWELEEFLSMTPTFVEPSEGGSLIWAVSMVYLGCWQDSGDRDLPSVTFIGATNSVSVCIQHCSSHGYTYAGLQYSTWCTCGNSYGKHEKRPESDCDDSCRGDSSQIWSVAAEYLGCRQDSADRDLPFLTHIGATNSVTVCIQHFLSHGYAYAGLQGEWWCLCGDSYGKHGQRPESDCDTSCPGDSSQICGSNMKNSVYSTY